LKILFAFPALKPYNSELVRSGSCGGTEKAVTFLGEALSQLGYDVDYARTTEEIAALSGNPTDVVITQEAAIFEKLDESVQKVWWVHHYADQPAVERNAAYARIYDAAIICLSQVQALEIARIHKMESFIIPHGIWFEELAQGVERDPYRLIYASTPFRGLERIPDLFRAIKAREPKATIAICSSMSVYGQDDDKYKPLFDELAAIDGVELLGAKNQSELYAEFARSQTLFYPCNWRETYCLALDEAVAHGCYPIVPDIGCFGERVDTFDDLVDAALMVLGQPAKCHFKPLSWLEVARLWEKEALNAPD
jgi:hypothetical protein